MTAGSGRLGAIPKLLLAALLLVEVTWVGSAYAGRFRCPPVTLIAHRGIAPVTSENTHAAFEEAQRRGFRKVETDVRISADGEFVLMHDENLRRTAARPERVSQLSLQDLREMHTRGGDRIPTVPDALRWAAVRDIHLLLELKHDRADGWTEERLQRLQRYVDEFDMTDRVTYLSFHADYLRDVERLDGSRRTAWIVRSRRPSVAEATRNADEVFVPLSFADAAFVRRMHTAGVQVGGLTTQRPENLRAFAGAGVVEVITDDLHPSEVRDIAGATGQCPQPRGGWG